MPWGEAIVNTASRVSRYGITRVVQRFRPRGAFTWIQKLTVDGGSH